MFSKISKDSKGKIKRSRKNNNEKWRYYSFWRILKRNWKNKDFFKRNHFKNNLLYETEILTLKAGVLKKVDNNNDKFIIKNNTIIERNLSDEEQKEIEGMSINIKIKINDDDNIFEVIYKFEIISSINIIN